MNRLHLALLASSSLGIATIACGGISDPNRIDGEGTVATVSGALTGTSVPANARVALVYRKITATSDGSASVEVASDVPVVAGKFTMNLGTPADHYFADLEGASFADTGSGSSGSSGSTDAPPPLPANDPAPTPGGSGGRAFFSPKAGNVAKRDIVGGGITETLKGAIAGFVVYADTNGNGKLDLQGPTASTPDQILGGNQELLLVNLKGGGTLDYEKLRDKSGILPTAGFNLAWTEGRWLPLNVVELKLSSSAQLPTPVCGYGGYSGGGSGGEPTPMPAPVDAGTSYPGPYPDDAGIGYGPYPAPGSPGLYCAPDGRSFTYSPPFSCPPYEPPVPGLCSGSVYDVATPCAGAGGYAETLPSSGTVPVGWPCPIAEDAGTDGGTSDGGPAPDAGSDGG